MSFVPQTASYTGTQVVTEVRGALGDLAGVLFTNADALAWVNAGQREVARELDLFGEATVALVAGQADYVIPVEIAKRIKDIQTIVIGSTRLRPMSAQQAQAVWMDPARDGLPEDGEPKWWFQRNQTVTLVPAPDADAVTDNAELTVQFTRQAVDLTSLGDLLDVPDSHYNVLVSYVQYRAHLVTQETELAAVVQRDWKAGLRDMSLRERRQQTDTYPALESNEAYY